MADDEDSDGGGEYDRDGEEEQDSLNLAGFLFGNIDERGELEDSEVLDEVR